MTRLSANRMLQVTRMTDKAMTEVWDKRACRATDSMQWVYIQVAAVVMQYKHIVLLYII